MDFHIHDFQIRVLIYREDNMYVAHGLEVDLLGYGTTENESLKELSDLLRNQISFSIHKKESHLLDFQAPAEFFEKWEKAHTDALNGIITGECKHGKLSVKAITIGFTRQEIKTHSHNRRHDFDLVPV